MYPNPNINYERYVLNTGVDYGYYPCYLLKSLTGLKVTNWVTLLAPPYIGGMCNPLANTNGDPHFRGAEGTRFDFNGLLDRSFCLLSDRRIHINMGIKGYRPIAKPPRHCHEEALTAEEVAELLQMRANGSLPESAKVAAALEREAGRLRGSSEGGNDVGALGAARDESAGSRASEEQNSIQYARHELEARLLKGKPIRSWIRELQLMWRDDTGAQNSAFLKARDGKEQGRGATGFIQRMVIDGRDVIPPFHPRSSISADGGFNLLFAETKSQPGRVEDEFHLKIEGVADLSVTARVAHPLMQTATEAQAHFNVHIEQLNHTEGIHGVLGQTFLGEASRAVRSLRHRLLTRLLREPVDVESSEGGDGLLDGRVQDYLTSGIAAPDCAFAAVWRRGEHESEIGDDGVDLM
ncbi:unnamed protein product [Closterium sp. NIES-64]|nr:unnamed protein product [Closterium sp. NIES-64]